MGDKFTMQICLHLHKSLGLMYNFNLLFDTNILSGSLGHLIHGGGMAIPHHLIRLGFLFLSNLQTQR